MAKRRKLPVRRLLDDSGASPLAPRVRAMLPAAHRLIQVGGIDPTASAEFSEYVPGKEPRGLSEEQLDTMIEWTEAHYLLGIAVGLLLNPVMFVKGGAR